MKKILFFCAMLMLSPFVNAQYSSVIAEVPNLSGDGITIVRNLSDSEVITYVKSNTIHQFSYEESSTMSYNYINLPSLDFDKIKVHDFRIINDVVFFCGEDTDNNYGVLGTFKAAELRPSISPTVHIDYFELSDIKTLTRLEAYIDPVSGNPRVSAVGYSRIGPCGIWACGVMVDCANFLPYGTTANVSIYNSYYDNILNENELWYDVVATDKWVVLVGFGHLGGQEHLTLRKFPKGNPTDPEMDFLYFYNEPRYVANEETFAVHLKDDEMAVSYRGTHLVNVTDFADFRIFNLNTMLNINSQEYLVPYKSYLDEMAYMNKPNYVVSLHHFPTPTFGANFVYLIPYQTSPYTSVYAHDTWDFRSVTNLDNNYFVGTGYFHFLLRDASASFPANNTYSSTPLLCPESEKLDIAIVDDMRMNKINAPLPSGGTLPVILPSSPFVTPNTMIIKCLSR